MRADAIVCRAFRVLRHGRFAWAVLAAIAALSLSHDTRGSMISVSANAQDEYGNSDFETGNNSVAYWPSPTHPDPYNSGTTASASGSVNEGDGDYVHPSLHGYATGKHGSLGGIVEGLASATARFSDNLYYDNDQIIDGLAALGSLHIYFVHHISGSISASTTTGRGVTFNASITSGYNGNTYRQSSFLNQAGQYDDYVTVSLPANALLQGNGVKATYKLELYVQGGTIIYNGSFQADVTADFSDTAALDTIYVGDANGNPIPDPTGLFQISGDDGPYVMGPPTPEPAGLALLGFAAMGLCRRCRPVRRR